ncbi:MAG: NRDE family protein [Lewinella sp.]|nr:NRDE family protein [Lewinella sp.]
MCTVTYVPTRAHEFFFTTNRDEAPGRSPQSLDRQVLDGAATVFPRDKGAGGTWIAAAGNERIICVLNGAFTAHRHQPPYRRSRGLMALDYFYFPDTPAFARGYAFPGMEPFTLVIWERGQLFDLRWDGADLHLTELPGDKPHIWSSAKLYPSEIRRKRETWFADWLARHPEPDEAAVRHFHAHAGDGDPHNDVIMNRANVVRTVSTTLIAATDQQWRMHYHDLLGGARDQASLPYMY